MKRIPIRVAKRLAEELGQSTVVIVAWEGESSPTPTGRSHVVTYGRTVQDCEWAANLGNQIKRKILGLPEEQCQVSPVRAKRGRPAEPTGQPQACECGTPAGEAGGDAWKCAVRRNLPSISCPCRCHRYLR